MGRDQWYAVLILAVAMASIPFQKTLTEASLNAHDFGQVWNQSYSRLVPTAVMQTSPGCYCFSHVDIIVCRTGWQDIPVTKQPGGPR